MSCDDCRKWIHDDYGRPKRLNNTNTLLARPKTTLPPCHRCPKVPSTLPPETPRKWEHAADMTPQLANIWAYYRRCKAVNRFPEDELVEDCAYMIAEAEQQAERTIRQNEASRQESLIQLLIKRRMS